MSSDDFELIITKHARDQMFNRGIDEDQIRKVISQGAKIKQTDGLKSIHGYIGVCYKIVGNKYVVKTVIIE